MATVTTYTTRQVEQMTQMGQRSTEHRDLARRREVPGTAEETAAKMIAAIPSMTHEIVRRQVRGGGIAVEHILRQKLSAPIKGKYEAHGVTMYDTDTLLHVVI